MNLSQEDSESAVWCNLRIFIAFTCDSNDAFPPNDDDDNYVKNNTYSSTLNLFDAGFEYLPKEFTIFTNNGKCRH